MFMDRVTHLGHKEKTAPVPKNPAPPDRDGRPLDRSRDLDLKKFSNTDAKGMFSPSFYMFLAQNNSEVSRLIRFIFTSI